MTLKSYLKQDNLASNPTQLYLFKLNEVKFPLLRLLQFLSDLKSTILCSNRKVRILPLLLHLLM